MKILVAGIVSLLAAVAEPAPQPVPERHCWPRADIDKVLTQTYGERRIASGVTSHGLLLEMYGRPDGDGWTILVTLPNGVSCLIVDGDSLELFTGSDL